MDDTPLDATPLPPRPSLPQYRKQAKELLRDSRAGDPVALERMQRCPRVRDAVASERAHDAPLQLALADAQCVIAREHGFESWPRFSAHVEALQHRHEPDARFEAAADAIVSGDEGALRACLRDDPALILARSSRAHHATLLHYVAANGVENFRQRSPRNAVHIARILLDAGAEVDAPADMYGAGVDATTMNMLVSSVHPARIGVQSQLVNALLDAGAAVDGVLGDGSPLLTAIAFHYPSAASTLAQRGARVDSIMAAAGLGRVDLVERFVAPGGAPRGGLVTPRVRWLPRDPRAQVERAFIFAAAFGHAPVVELLARRGVSLAAADGQGFTALHWAAWYGRLRVVDLLIELGAPLEARNVHGGTVLGTVEYASEHSDGVFGDEGPLKPDYAAVIERLLAAGAISAT